MSQTAPGATAGTLGVGVIGASSMVYRAVFVDAFAAVDGVRLVHEASGAGDFSQTATADDAVACSTDYRAVLDDEAVDLVYLPLPNHLHEGWVVQAVEAGKHVLCEKPLGMDAASARRMYDSAEAAGVQLVEAYMSPHHPRSQAVLDAVADGRIGPVVRAEARMCGVLPADNHRWRAGTGGGALLDVGIYCLEPMLSAIGWQPGQQPTAIAAASTWGGEGVDASTAFMLTFDGGVTVDGFVSVAAPDQQRLQVTGAEGAIEVARHATPDRRDSGYVMRALDGTTTEVATDTGSCYEGIVAEARDVVRGAPRSRSVERSIALIALIDQIAAAAGHQRA